MEEVEAMVVVQAMVGVEGTVEGEVALYRVPKVSRRQEFLLVLEEKM